MPAPSSFFSTIKSLLRAPNPASKPNIPARRDSNPVRVGAVTPASGGSDPNSPHVIAPVGIMPPHGTLDTGNLYTDPDDNGLDKCPEFDAIVHRSGGSAFPVSLPWFVENTNTAKQQACSSAVPSFTSPGVIPLIRPTANQPSTEAVIHPRPLLNLPPDAYPDDYPNRPPLVFSQSPAAPVYRVGPFESKF